MIPPRVREDAVEFVLPDPERRLRSVALEQQVVRPRDGPPFEWRDGSWRLAFARPLVDRLEYLLSIDGERMRDPANTLSAPNPFGDRSVVEWPEYRAPTWLDAAVPAGKLEPVELRCRRLVARVPALLYSTADPAGPEAPLLVVHDGPEYDRFAALTRCLDALRAQGRIPPLHAALLQPIDRGETYSASALYAAALVRELLPQLAELAPHGRRIGVGASLGAVALLHAHARHPGSFHGLLLQSGSFFRQRFDKHESGFPRYRRITRFVGAVVRGAIRGTPVPVALSWGAAEENRANNRVLAAALATHGYPVRTLELRDAHTWTCWRDALDPALPDLMAAGA